MASEVDISNLALSHLGERASVVSINPPEGSSFAPLCQIWFPVARRFALSIHDWNFATRRAEATLLTEVPLMGWAHAYAKPANSLTVFAVLPPGADGDVFSSQLNKYAATSLQGFIEPYAAVAESPQDFIMETLDDGSEVIYTNQADALMRFTVDVTDTGRFTPLFDLTLSHILASYLAGPILKGDVGRAESKAQLQMAMGMLGMAAKHDMRQQKSSVRPAPSWIRNR